MKFNLTVITLFFLGFISSAQQIGDGYAPSAITDFSAPLKSGIYNGLNGVTAGVAPDGSHAWQHLIVARHTNTTNNYQLQINSSFTDNDRLFFRKTSAGSLVSANSAWRELATRGANTFIGNQNITGTLAIDAYQSTSLFSVGKNHGVKLSIGNSAWSNTSIIETGWTDQNGDFTDIKVPGSGSNTALIRILKNGNVGMGVTTPSNKLDVNGTIHSKEVKIDMTGWADFVFKKDYDLPTLQEVEKQIVEKGHLENIPNEEEVLKNGINLGEMNAKLLQKIEELTLYVIEQNKQIIDLKQRLNKVEVNSK